MFDGLGLSARPGDVLPWSMGQDWSRRALTP